jgi:hypothetical protein
MYHRLQRMALSSERDPVPHFGHLKLLKANDRNLVPRIYRAPLDQKSSSLKRLS